MKLKGGYVTFFPLPEGGGYVTFLSHRGGRVILSHIIGPYILLFLYPRMYRKAGFSEHNMKNFQGQAPRPEDPLLSIVLHHHSHVPDQWAPTSRK